MNPESIFGSTNLTLVGGSLEGFIFNVFPMGTPELVACHAATPSWIIATELNLGKPFSLAICITKIPLAYSARGDRFRLAAESTIDNRLILSGLPFHPFSSARFIAEIDFVDMRQWPTDRFSTEVTKNLDSSSLIAGCFLARNRFKTTRYTTKIMAFDPRGGFADGLPAKITDTDYFRHRTIISPKARKCKHMSSRKSRYFRERIR